MDKIIKEVLYKIENNGYTAYLVGGYVRDYLLGKKTLDVDICTNALPKDLHKIFQCNASSNNYGGFNLNIKGFNIDITTFRKELNYENRKPAEIVYIDSLEEDIKRRDFTINSICMDKFENTIDPVNGINDLNNRVIRMTGNIKERLTEDPLRILRAIRFACILDFELEKNLYNEILESYELVSTLSDVRIKSEINKILLNKNFLKGLKLLEELKILDLLKISYNEVTYVNDICGMWAQLNFSKDYSFTKQEKINIINIRKIIEFGNIDNEILFKYGLYNSLVACEILNINKKKINNMYKNLPIKSINDLQISNKEIITILNIQPSKIISDIKNELVSEILKGNINNRNNELKKYVLNRKEM